MSDIQDYIEGIMKKHETLPTNPLVHTYINRVNNRLVFKMKDELNLELQMSITMNSFDSTRKLIGKTKNGENVTSP